MNPEAINTDSSVRNEVEKPNVVEVNEADTQLLLPASSSATSSTDTQWQQYGEQIGTFLQSLPTYVTRFFDQNKSLLTSLGVVFGALLAVKLTLALVDAIDDIPLVSLTLKLVGLGYTTWFVYRYLLTAASRQELSDKFASIKEQILGTANRSA